MTYVPHMITSTPLSICPLATVVHSKLQKGQRTRKVAFRQITQVDDFDDTAD